MASKRDAKRDAEEEEEDEEDDDEEISGSEEEEDDDDEDSGSEDEMSESGDARGADAEGASKAGGKTAEKGSERSLQNQPFDEAVDLSESEDSVADPGRESPKKTTKTLKNLPFDEALELSASAQDLESPVKKPAPASRAQENDKGKAAAPSGAKDTAAPGAELKNRPFDEEVDLSDSGDSVDTNEPSSPPKVKQNTPAPAAKVKETIAPMPKKDDMPPPKQVEERAPPQASAAASSASKAPEKKAPEPKRKEVSESSSEGSESEEDDDEDDDEEEEEEEEAPPPRGKSGGAAAAGGSSSAAGALGAGANASATHATMLANAGEYKESEYAHLKVSNDIKELFQYIGRFKPQEIELETRLKCFIPEYIPAVGDMDAFLKIPRPDNEADHLGLKMLDEPSLNQSDATVLDLQLRSTSKKKHGDIVVRSIENAEKSPKEIDRWIKSIADLHRTKPPPQVHYTKPMPDIESLMQVWPEEFEELLSKTTLPSASMDMSVEQYLRVICAILDIPVYKNVYESVHVLFTLYLEFRSNQHFMNYDDNAPVMMNGNANGGQSSPPPFTSRRDDSQDEYVSSSRK